MRRLPVCRTRDDAGKSLNHGAWWRGIRPASGPGGGQVALVWVPHFLFTFHMESPQAPGETTVSVDACSAAFAIFQMEEDLLDTPPAEGEVLPGLVPRDEALKTGRHRLVQAIMRRRGSHGPKPVPGELLREETILFPFWLAYVTRKDGRLDIRLHNAATGEPGGNQTRTGVLHAFVALSRDQEGDPPGKGRA